MANDRFTFSSAGLVHDLEMAMDRAGGWNSALVKHMCKEDRLAHIREYLLGLAEIRYLNSVISLDRTTPFNPVQFLGEGWSIWKGPADGDGLSGQEEQDKRSLVLTEVDLSQVQLVTLLKDGDGDNIIQGEENLKRFKYILLDAQVFQTLWENKHLIPEHWKKTNGNTTHVFFPGTTLRSPFGSRRVLCLCWRAGGWHWRCSWLASGWYVHDSSAVLAS
ncbi:MAG: hypothetical protein HY452_00375 [Parcubacteria group bacterium]|nr:hypothetical protein [Parcubacteria group bacterium]